MDPQRDNQQREVFDLPPELPPQEEFPPPSRRNITVFIVIGAVILIILIAITVIFFFIRSRTVDTRNGVDTVSPLTPQPTPGFYDVLTGDIQKQEAKLKEVVEDLKELDALFAYESVNFSDVLTPPPAQTMEWESQKVEIAKARAELEIDRRMTILDKLNPKIDMAEKLSSAQKSVLKSEVEAQIPFLSSLRDRIVRQGSYSALVGDINTIFDSYKNHQVTVLKVSIVITADKINVSGDEFISIAERLAKKAGELQSLGKDVSSVQKTLGHMLFVLGDAANKAENATVLVLPLASEDFSKDRSVLGNAKSNIQTSRNNLNSALSDARNILNALNSIETGKAPQRNFFQFFPLFQH